MTTTGIPPALAVQTADTAAAAKKSANGQISQNQFLTLFVAQLKNQDPLSPMEPNDLTAQLAQFSSLEQLTGINDKLDKLAAPKDTGPTPSDALAMLGRDVDFDASRMAVTKGKAAPVKFTLSKDVSNAIATVRSADGETLRRVVLGDLKAGAQTFTFDGKDDKGAPFADGNYQVSISAVPAGSTVALNVPLLTRATVDGVDLSASPPVLIVGDRRLTLDQIRGVHLADTNS